MRNLIVLVGRDKKDFENFAKDLKLDLRLLDRDTDIPCFLDSLEDFNRIIIVATLGSLGIDRYSIMRCYLQGTTEDVRRVLRRIFPNVEQIIRPPPHVVRAQPRVVSRGSEVPTYVVPSSYGYGWR